MATHYWMGGDHRRLLITDFGRSYNVQPTSARGRWLAAPKIHLSRYAVWWDDPKKGKLQVLTSSDNLEDLQAHYGPGLPVVRMDAARGQRATVRNAVCGIEAAAFLNEHPLSGKAAWEYIVDLSAELGCDPEAVRAFVVEHLYDSKAAQALRATRRKGAGNMFGLFNRGGRRAKNPALRRMTWEEWRRDHSGWDEYPDVSEEKRQIQKKWMLKDWSRPNRMFDYAQYGWTQQPLVAFANEVITIPATDFYPSYTRKKGYSDYAVIGGVAFAVGRKHNDMTLDYVDNKTGKVRTGRAVYRTQSAVMKRVGKVAGIASPGQFQKWPSKSFEYQGRRAITTRQRRRMPQSEFALPITAQSREFKDTHPRFAGAYPMEDRSHGANARGRAIQMLNSGHLSLKEARTIFARTSAKWGFEEKDIVQVDGRWESVPVGAAPRRAAANRSRTRGRRRSAASTEDLLFDAILSGE